MLSRGATSSNVLTTNGRKVLSGIRWTIGCVLIAASCGRAGAGR
jgi:hypothetical protein